MLSTPDIAFFALLLGFIGIAVCLVVTALAYRGMHYNAPFLRWWSVALLCVLMLHYNRIAAYPRAVIDEPFLMIEGLLSNLGNLAVLAMVGSASGLRVPYRKIKKAGRWWLVGLSTCPVWMILIEQIMLSGPLREVAYDLYGLVVRLECGLFSAYTLLYAGKRFSRAVVSLSKAVGLWFVVYGAYQLLYIPFAFHWRLGSLGNVSIEPLYLGAALVFKVAATFLLVSVASEISKARQLAAMAKAEYGADVQGQLQKINEGKTRVLVVGAIKNGILYEGIRKVLRDCGVDAVIVPQERLRKVSVTRLFSVAIGCRFGLGVFEDKPSELAWMMLQAVLGQRKGCLVLAHESLAWRPDEYMAPEFYARYSTESQVITSVERWAKIDVRPLVIRTLDRVPEILQAG